MRAKRTGRSRTDATAPTRFTRGYVPPPRLGEERPRPRHRFRRALRVRLIRCAPRRSLRPFGAGLFTRRFCPRVPPALPAGCATPVATIPRPFGAKIAHEGRVFPHSTSATGGRRYGTGGRRNIGLRARSALGDDDAARRTCGGPRAASGPPRCRSVGFPRRRRRKCRPDRAASGSGPRPPAPPGSDTR